MQKRDPTSTDDSCGCCRPTGRQIPPPQKFLIEKFAKFALVFIFAGLPLIVRYLLTMNVIIPSMIFDFGPTHIFCIIIGTLFSVFLKHFSSCKLVNFVIPYLRRDCSKQFDPVKEKFEKVADSIRGMAIDIIIFVLTTVFTFNSDAYPVGFGGRLNLSKEFLPGSHKEPGFGSHFVLLFVMGHYIERIWFEITEGRKSPILFTKLFHHTLTIFLIVICLSINYSHLGLPVILTHTITGVFLCASRILAETIFSDLYNTNYIVLLFSWFYSRIFVFMVEIIVPLAKEISTQGKQASLFMPLFVTLLAFLMLLFGFDVYWGIQLAILGIRKNMVWLQIQILGQSSRMN